MTDRQIENALQRVIQRERANGCCMADESLISPAIRRWRSHPRRNKSSKDRSLEHQTRDLKKGLMSLFTEYNYDESCVEHLAESFAEILSKAKRRR